MSIYLIFFFYFLVLLLQKQFAYPQMKSIPASKDLLHKLYLYNTFMGLFCLLVVNTHAYLKLTSTVVTALYAKYPSVVPTTLPRNSTLFFEAAGSWTFT